ncbi:conserved hypothetical protein [Coccidioides posadasii str. Silveira]|uniref:Uncharacterized protein n=1 Tax=Coccidioides posadasii (strain RMSCC 757 / Silveira) TaxID=443226 RepID=E9D9X8_COCPS|nr:conserved hypothetical protein [Coccidioides posadasii str. Silveira]
MEQWRWRIRNQLEQCGKGWATCSIICESRCVYNGKIARTQEPFGNANLITRNHRIGAKEIRQIGKPFQPDNISDTFPTLLCVLWLARYEHPDCRPPVFACVGLHTYILFEGGTQARSHPLSMRGKYLHLDIAGIHPIIPRGGTIAQCSSCQASLPLTSALFKLCP